MHALDKKPGLHKVSNLPYSSNGDLTFLLSHSQEDTSDWLLTDEVSSWAGSPADRGWRYLKLSLERYDSSETEFQYSKVVLETILGIDRLSSLPLWLIQTLEVSQTLLRSHET